MCQTIPLDIRQTAAYDGGMMQHTTTVKAQLVGIRKGTDVRLTGPGTGAYGATRFTLKDRNLNGCAVFEPVTTADKVFVPLTATDFRIARV